MKVLFVAAIFLIQKKVRVSLNRYDVSLVHIRCGRLAQTIYRLIGLAQFRAVCQGY